MGNIGLSPNVKESVLADFHGLEGNGPLKTCLSYPVIIDGSGMGTGYFFFNRANSREKG